MYNKNSEKGQALVIIALSAVGLFAFTALAIDGSRVFSDRRHAQNAADTAALAAALAKIRTPNYPPNAPNAPDLAAIAAGEDRARGVVRVGVGQDVDAFDDDDLVLEASSVGGGIVEGL